MKHLKKFNEHCIVTTYNQEVNEFTNWCEKSDNIDSYIYESKSENNNNNNNNNNIDKINQWFEKPNNLSYIESKYPYDIAVNNIDIANSIKDKFEVEIIKIIYKGLKQPLRYHIIYQNWKSVSDLKSILSECYDDLVEHGFISTQQIESYRKMSEGK